MNGLALDIAIILGPLLAIYLVFDQWASREERRVRRQRAHLSRRRDPSAHRGSVGHAAVTSTAPALPRGDLVRSPGKTFIPGGLVPPARNARVYDWDLDREHLEALALAPPQDAIAILDQLDEIRRLPETEEPGR